VGDWRVIGTGLTDDAFPYAPETEDWFALLLAERLCAVDGTELSPHLARPLQRARNALRARYRQRVQTDADLGVLRLSDIGRGSGGYFNLQDAINGRS
jgi:hypothetical protein